MSSQRHNTSGGSASRQAYLDAARACILDVGWRRTTLTEVARRAGVSRMTIYRAWQDMSELLGDLMTREWGDVVATVSSHDGDGPDPDGIATTMTEAARALRDNELFVRIVELDPELLLPYLFARRGRSQQLILGILQDAITRGQAAGTVRDGDPAAMARSLLLAMHGSVLSAHTMVDDDVDQAALDAELGELVRRALLPLGGR
ncbi:TetR/AcrR family transcriptional regulator [Nocardioides panacisoli]|uniref:TetR/AcrR family transcriptional regulator n=1 Tax=Nocardioides panacisoli TaxID=627624 RepID=UPI001C6320EA|nr:TetR/AcrR family transcriptional regulator [Nocardioides panacisoli]QYJ03434.1 TetR/AcrR family transcriptional regulator [Nocardioides panacisoli]